MYFMQQGPPTSTHLVVTYSAPNTGVGQISMFIDSPDLAVCVINSMPAMTDPAAAPRACITALASVPPAQGTTADYEVCDDSWDCYDSVKKDTISAEEAWNRTTGVLSLLYCIV